MQVYASFQPMSQPHKRATHSDVLQALDDQKNGADLVILDARGHEQYTGQVRAMIMQIDKGSTAVFDLQFQERHCCVFVTMF